MGYVFTQYYSGILEVSSQSTLICLLNVEKMWDLTIEPYFYFFLIENT